MMNNSIEPTNILTPNPNDNNLTAATASTSNAGTEQNAYSGNIGATGLVSIGKSFVNGGRFDFDDGGTYCGGWEDGKAHGHGICTGPKGQGIYSGSWHYGFEVSGAYKWPSGSGYEGQWQNGKRHGLGIEGRGRWLYRGEWTQGFKGRYGVRQSISSAARYEGTWANGLQDGYGSETYADGGIYQGQWLRGMRHGYGVRTSAPFGQASRHRATNSTYTKQKRDSISSLQSAELEVNERRDRKVDDLRGGFVLRANSDEVPVRRRSLTEKPSQIKRNLFAGLKIRKQKSTGDLEKRATGSVRSNSSTASWMSTDSNQSISNAVNTTDDSNASFLVEDEQLDPNVTETYFGEWKNDKRSGFGISERSDGLRYEGEWFANKKYGYGITTFRDGTREEGKYKNNVLITSQKKKHLFLIRSTKFREKIDAAVNAAQRASKIALQKADIAISRTATARGKAEQADIAAENAREDCDIAVTTARKIAPDFDIPFLDKPNLRSVIKTITAAAIVSSTSNSNSHSFPLKSVLKKTTNYPNSISEFQTERTLNTAPQSQSQQYLASTTSSSGYQSNKPTDDETHSLTVETLQSIPDKVPAQKFGSASSDMSSSLRNDGTYSEKSDENIPSDEYNLHKSQPPIGFSSNYYDHHKSPQPHSQSEIGSASSTSRRNPKLAHTVREPSIDHYDHYKRAPSRDCSLDRYSRVTSRLSNSSRGTSIDRSTTVLNNSNSQLPNTDKNGLRGSSQTIINQPILTTINKNQNLQSFAQIPPFEDIIMRNRTLGQDIVPSLSQPKRTESLFIKPANEPQPLPNNNQTLLQRKKSLPDVQSLPVTAGHLMSREEVSYLSSARREEVRRQLEERERIRANPFLYFVSPQFKDWFSRQQLLIFLLLFNLSLGILFFKLLTS